MESGNTLGATTPKALTPVAVLVWRLQIHSASFVPKYS